MTTATITAETTPLPVEAVSKHRLRGLDGLRALAVSSIIVYHDAVAELSGGFLGVPIFFVLSGYLITRLLLEEFTDHGEIRLLSFWERRIKHLYPELLGMIAVTFLAVIILGRALKDPTVTLIDLSQVRLDAVSGLLCFANWRFIASGVSYFTMTGGLSSLFKPLWWLAVEGQFYLLWPPAVIGLLRLSHHRWRRNGLVVTAALAIASALEMVLLYSPSDPSRVWYGTDTNVIWLAIGAFLAFLTTGVDMDARLERFVSIAVWPSAALTLVVLFAGGTGQGVPRQVLFEGGFVAIGLAVAIILAFVVHRQGSRLTSALSLKPLVAIGLASYGAYLYHWGVFLLVDEHLTGLTGAALFWVRIAVTAGLTAASYYLVKPLVYKKRSRAARAVVYPLAVIVTMAVVFAGSTAGIVYRPKASAQGASRLSAIAGVGLSSGEIPILLSSMPSAADPLRVLGFGDSQQVINTPAMSSALEQGTGGAVTFSTAAFPGWGLTPASIQGLANQARQQGAQIVMGSTVWNSAQIISDNGAFMAIARQLVEGFKSAGVEGVIFLSTPPTSGVTSDADSVTYPVINRAIPIWAQDMRALAREYPGFVEFFNIGPSYALGGAFSGWLPPVGHLDAPLDEWIRVRATDGIHACAQGAELYATALEEDFHLEFGTPATTSWQSETAWQTLQASKQAAGVCPADHPPNRPSTPKRASMTTIPTS